MNACAAACIRYADQMKITVRLDIQIGLEIFFKKKFVAVLM